MKTPVVLLLFNRPELTVKVFAAVRAAQPEQLLIVADGPRADRPDDRAKCDAVRAIAESVDWDCQVFKNYADVNLGCKQRVASGLDWVFSLVESAIILEDDCLPHPSFFQFCEELLDYYRHDQRIMVISGDNFQFGQPRRTDQTHPYSYYFSIYNHCWGWATWRRAWKLYDINMTLWPLIKDGNWLVDLLHQRQLANFWRKIFQAAYDNRINSWDYHWTFACWLNHGLTVLPTVNLVSNIGFGQDATHTQHTHNRLANLPVGAIAMPLRHPPYMIADTQADWYTHKTMFAWPLHRRIAAKLQQILGFNWGK